MSAVVSMKSMGAFLAAALAVAALQACKTESFCFDDCDGPGGFDGGAFDGSGNGGGPQFNTGGTGGGLFFGSGGAVETDGGCATEEICNGLDDDCDGEVDEDIDFTNPRQCGTCTNNCITAFGLGVDPESIACDPPPDEDLGKTPGTCSFSACAQDFYDLDEEPENGCEYQCFPKPDGETCNGQDDDCDGVVDNGFDFCEDDNNCGRCGRSCFVSHGTGECVYDSARGDTCNEDTTRCRISECEENWYDIDGSAVNGCEYNCTPTGDEICDGLDNDCDGQIDNADPDIENVAEIGEVCYGGERGECAAETHAGVKKCVGAAIRCCDQDSDNQPAVNPALPETGVRNGICEGVQPPFVLRPDDVVETCNNLDDDCDGQVDDSPTDAGGQCGQFRGSCSQGTQQCVSGNLECVGSVGPQPDVCNGVDDDCDGVIDGTLPSGAVTACTSNSQCSGGRVCLVRNGPTDRVCATPASDVGGACGQPPAAPCVNATGQIVACGTSGATRVPQPCSAGVLTCTGGVKQCVGAVSAPQATDKCGEDTNCDGTLDSQPDLQSSVSNCGTCGNDCRVAGDHINWRCSGGSCSPQPGNKCQAGYIDCDSNANDCERACIPSGAEQCNGFDDDCDCNVDEAADLMVPTPPQVCGVAPGVTDPRCTAGTGSQRVRVTCNSGQWRCTFPSGYCTGGNCSTTVDVCDGRDNNCDSTIDEGFTSAVRATAYLGQPCASDDGDPPPGDGVCRGTGSYVCNQAGTDTVCNAQFNSAARTNESCNGLDDDCDGLVDERFGSVGTQASYVRPAVVNIGSGVWMFKYEASRPNSNQTSPGSGNGYHTSAPAGITLDRTIACSVETKIPWFNVTPDEAAQTCAERGGRLCTSVEWQRACEAAQNPVCLWGYSTGCRSPANYPPPDNDTPFCNLHEYDFDTSAAGIQDGLLPTRWNSTSGNRRALSNCGARYGGSSANDIFDITGNLREITRNGSSTTSFILRGGAFNTASENGARCDFSFYNVNQNFRFFDTGFRCCFTTNPSP